MVYLGLLIMIIILFFSFLLNRNFVSPVFIFSGLFSLIISLALLKLNGIREFTNGAVYSIELGVIFFAIGAILVRSIFDSSKKTKDMSPENDLLINWKWTKILLFLVTAGTVITLFNVINLLLSGGDYYQVRSSLLGYNESDSLINNSILNGLVYYISGPGLYALTPLAIYFFATKKHRYFCVLVFLNIILNSFATGGRITLVYVIIQFIATISFVNIKLSRKTKRILMCLIAVSLITIGIISNARSNRSIVEIFYAYFSGPVVLLSEWQKIVDNSNIWTFGLSFLYPFSYIVNTITNVLGLKVDFLGYVVSLQGAPQETWINVFPNMPMNAFVTMFYFFYQDLRFFGIIVYSTLYGIFCNYIYCKAYIKMNINYFIVYLLVIKSIFGAFMIWQLGSTSFFVSFVMLLLCLRGASKRKGSRINDY